MYYKQCRPWSVAAFCSVWSRSILFTKAYLSQYLGLLRTSVKLRILFWFVSQLLPLFNSFLLCSLLLLIPTIMFWFEKFITSFTEIFLWFTLFLHQPFKTIQWLTRQSNTISYGASPAKRYLRIQDVLRMRKVSSRPLISIDTSLVSNDSVSGQVMPWSDCAFVVWSGPSLSAIASNAHFTCHKVQDFFLRANDGVWDEVDRHQPVGRSVGLSVT